MKAQIYIWIEEKHAVISVSLNEGNTWISYQCLKNIIPNCNNTYNILEKFMDFLKYEKININDIYILHYLQEAMYKESRKDESPVYFECLLEAAKK